MTDLAEVIVEAVLRELDGRGGFDSWWSDIDPAVQREVRESLQEVVDGVLESTDE